MYYVNHEQIDARLRFIPVITDTLRAVVREQGTAPIVLHFAQERALHLAIEAVTDVGSLLIDAFMMRDASGYEDIVDILRVEGVLPDDVADGLRSLVALRRPLTQAYMDLERTSLRDDLEPIAALLERFPPLVTAFVNKELQPFG
ncbi:DUF86 domain-containing protein [Paenibacillus sp. TRM 82003]|nr:DUF86 domain-containing protein [Paenibacillus sp. TRM 82003]